MNTSAAAAINADYMAGAVQEALRLAAAASPSAPPPPVRAFAKPSYRDGFGERVTVQHVQLQAAHALLRVGACALRCSV